MSVLAAYAAITWMRSGFFSLSDVLAGDVVLAQHDAKRLGAKS
jgi:hypothetical protein